MSRWLRVALRRIRKLARERRVMFTLKARRELAGLQLGLDEDDACDVLAKLEASDSIGGLLSEATGEWMYLFKPSLAGTIVYVKVILRNDCIVISFHEDEASDE